MNAIKRRLIYRYIAWTTRKRMKRFGIGLLDSWITDKALKDFLPAYEYDQLINFKNTATQIIDRQSQDLKDLRGKDIIEDFRHMELVGDNPENPFEGVGNDIPMLALCRTIETDLREMLDETDLPPEVEPIKGVLM